MGTLDDLTKRRPVNEDRVSAIEEEVRQELRAYRLKELRENLGFTQAQVAGEIGVSQERVSAFERGKIDSARLKTLKDYAEALGGTLRVEVELPNAVYKIA